MANRDPGERAGVSDDEPDRVPTISCSRCNQEWELSYELDELYAGNQAIEQFSLDHQRHTGHYPDDVTPWILECKRCPDGEDFLSERPARRWANTHARHTGHTVEMYRPDGSSTPIDAPAGGS